MRPAEPVPAPARSLLRLGPWLILLSLAAAGNAQNPSPPVADLYAQAQTLIREGRLAEANLALEQALQAAPNNLAVITLLGKVSARIGHKQQALLLLQKAVTLAPDSAEAHYDLSIALAAEPDLPAALNEATRSVQLAPGSAAIHRNRAKVLVGLERLQEATSEYKHALSLDPDDPLALYDLALLEEQAGSPADEAPLLERLTRLTPSNPVPFYMLGQCRSRLGDQPGAMAAWRQALQLNPDYRGPLYQLAQALKTSDPAASAALMRRFMAVQQRDDSLDQVRNLGNKGYQAMQNGSWKPAAQAFREAIALCNGCVLLADLEKNLGLAECHDNELDAGERDLRLALKLKPADPDILQAIQAAVHQRASAR